MKVGIFSVYINRITIVALKFDEFWGEMAKFENYSSFNENRSASFAILLAGLCNLSLRFIRVGSNFKIC